MFFCELPVGARYRFGGLEYTKTSTGGNCTNAAGEPDWCASHNFVELVDGTSTPVPVPMPAMKTQSTTGMEEFAKLFPAVTPPKKPRRRDSDPI